MATRKLSATETPIVDDRLAEPIAKHRLDSIIHEAGHLTVALALGYPAEARIEPNETDDPMYEKAWTGSCRVAFWVRVPTNREKTMIALAGWLAELLHENPDADLYEEVCGFLDEGLSGTDLRLATINNRWIVKWAEEVWGLLMKYSDFRAWAAERLSSDEFIAEEEAVEAFPAKTKFARYRAFNQASEKHLQEAARAFAQIPEAPAP